MSEDSTPFSDYRHAVVDDVRFSLLEELDSFFCSNFHVLLGIYQGFSFFCTSKDAGKFILEGDYTFLGPDKGKTFFLNSGEELILGFIFLVC